MKKNRKHLLSGAAFFLVLLLLVFTRDVSAASFSQKAPEPTFKWKDTTLIIRWDKRADLTGYKVYTCDASGKKRVLIQKTHSNKITLKNLKTGTIGYYQVRGYLQKKGKVSYTECSRPLKVQVYPRSTLKQLLLTALEPVGSTMYVWGGGWDEADVGAGIDARTLGVSPRWKQFFQNQTSSYNYQNTRYQIRNGLDCSGYVGWCIYNIMETRNGRSGYVMYAQQMAQNFASRGWGKYAAPSAVRNHRAGDIMSTSSGHVWIAVGSCTDGSVVLLHSSPPGVQLVGTPTPSGNGNSRAVYLARYYMKKYFPEWYRKFPNCSRGISYLTQYSQMRWDITGNAVMTDPDDYRNKTADQILKDLFKSRK